ncbi:ABC transporter ATP-binding protein [Microbacterium sp. OR16]|uniref:ABC transporter ATP-binding protein n=1 Tax=Microbacterium sp. OR16 TaxID=3095345 RepID=UPI0039B5500C
MSNVKTMEPILIEGVGITFDTAGGPVTALEGVSVQLEAGSFTSLLGPSGCGKSTLLRIISDLLTPTAGTVTVLGQTPQSAREGRDLGFVFQDAALLPWRNAIENVLLPLEIGPGKATGEDRDRAQELLALVGLGGRAEALPSQLSGGQRQRVSIARALITRPKVLLMDEPFGALDEITRDRLNEELLSIWKLTGTTIVFVTHSIAEAVFLSQRVVVMSAQPGRISQVHDIDLPGDRSRAVRTLPEFGEYEALLRQALEGA